MTKYISDQNRTCFMYESGTGAAGYGNPSGATKQWLGLVQDSTLEPNMNVMQIRYQGSTDRNVNDFADGRQEWNGTITYYPQDWKFLGFAIGSITETITTGSHLFTETNSNDRVLTSLTPLSSFTIEDSKDTGTAGSNFIRTTNGGMVDSYKMTAAMGEIVSCEIGYIAQNSYLGSDTVSGLAATTTTPYMFNNVQLHIPSGTKITNATEVTFNINNNLEPGFYLNGSRMATELLPMNREYEVTATATMDTANANTIYDSYYIAGSTFNAMIYVAGVAGSLSLTMSGCKMTDMTIPSPLEGVQEQSFTIVPKTVFGVAYDSIADYNAW